MKSQLVLLAHLDRNKRNITGYMPSFAGCEPLQVINLAIPQEWDIIDWNEFQKDFEYFFNIGCFELDKKSNELLAFIAQFEHYRLWFDRPESIKNPNFWNKYRMWQVGVLPFVFYQYHVESEDK